MNPPPLQRATERARHRPRLDCRIAPLSQRTQFVRISPRAYLELKQCGPVGPEPSPRVKPV